MSSQGQIEELFLEFAVVEVFELEAHATRGQPVRLHAEGTDGVKDKLCFAGGDHCEIRLVAEEPR